MVWNDFVYVTMVEVFKIDIQHQALAERLVTSLLEQFPEYKINVDLTDCDKILRVESTCGKIQSDAILDFAKQAEIDIEILPDL